MEINITEFKKHAGRYLDMSTSEDIFITKNGKIAAKIVKANASTEAAADDFETLKKDIMPRKK